MSEQETSEGQSEQMEDLDVPEEQSEGVTGGVASETEDEPELSNP